MGFWDIKYNTLGIPYIGNAPAEGIDITKKTIIGGQIVGMGAAKTIWSGLGTTGKIGAGAIAGGSVVYAYDWLFGSSKKDAPQNLDQNLKQNQAPVITPIITVTPVVTQPNYTNIYQYDYSQLYNYINGNNNVIDSKKSMSANPIATWETPFTTTQPLDIILKQEGSQSASQAKGTDFTTIAVIAAVGLVAYGYTSRSKHGK